MTFPGMDKPAFCMPDTCFCEIIHEDGIKQPMNTYSSVIFILIGILLFVKFLKRERNTNTSPFYNSLSYPLIYIFSLIIIGLGSIYFHTSLNFWGQFADVSGMNLLAGFILVYHLKRKHFISNFSLSFIILNIILDCLLFTYPVLRRYLFTIVILLSLFPLYIPSLQTKFIFKLKYRKPTLPQGFLLNNNSREKVESPLSKINTNYNFFRIALYSQTIALLFWILDITKIMCVEDSFLQGHSLWHLFGGVACYYLYLFYESEKLNEEIT